MLCFKPMVFDKICLNGIIFKVQSMRILNQLLGQMKSVLKFLKIFRKNDPNQKYLIPGFA